MSQMMQSAQDSQSALLQDGARMFPTANDLPEETRVPVIKQLNQSLADTTDLATQMKFAHWNVKGMDFYQLHLLFDEIAELLNEHADTIAERVTALGGQAMGTARMAAGGSRIPEMTASTVSGPAFVEAAAEHLSAHAANLRADIDYAVRCGDEDTADLYAELSREVDKRLYFLEAHLQTEPLGTVDQMGQTGGNGHRPEWSGAQQQAQSPQRMTFTGGAQQGQQAPQAPQTQQGQQTWQGQQVKQGQRAQQSPGQFQQPPQQ